MGAIRFPEPPVPAGAEGSTINVEFETPLLGSSQELVDLIKEKFPSFSYVAESTAYFRFENPWWFAGRLIKGNIRVGPKNYISVGNKSLHIHIPSLQPWKIIKPVNLVGKLRIPAGAAT